VQVRYRSAGRWQDPEAAFPLIDYATLRIELYRAGGCFGSCPIYSVPSTGLAGDFAPMAGLTGLLVLSSRTLWNSCRCPDVAHRSGCAGRLIDRFSKAHFLRARKAYAYPISDSPTYVLRFSTGGHVMEVLDHIGGPAGMPHVVTELEDAVDEAAGTKQWIGVRSRPHPVCSRRLDVASEAAQEGVLVARSWRCRRDRLIEHGMPLDAPFTRFGREETMPLGVFLLTAAIKRTAGAFHRARLRGWLGRTPRDTLNRAFADGAAGCDPALAKRLYGAVPIPTRMAPGARQRS